MRVKKPQQAVRHVTLFARAPRYGCVKRRLARDIGKPETLRFYRNNIRRIIKVLCAMPQIDYTVSMTPDLALRTLDRAHFLGAPMSVQGPGNLGTRMRRAFTLVNRRDRLIIGSDIPEIKAQHLNEAFGALASHDVVFGPGRDGGYWLVGLSRRTAVLRGFLSSVEWSTPQSLEQSVASLAKHYKFAYVSMLEDIDQKEQYDRWRCRDQGEVTRSKWES